MQPFIKSGLTFTILQLQANELNLIERLQSILVVLSYQCYTLEILQDKLSMPAALDGFKPFKIFNISSGDVSENWKFKSLKLILS